MSDVVVGEHRKNDFDENRNFSRDEQFASKLNSLFKGIKEVYSEEEAEILIREINGLGLSAKNQGNLDVMVDVVGQHRAAFKNLENVLAQRLATKDAKSDIERVKRGQWDKKASERELESLRPGHIRPDGKGRYSAFGREMWSRMGVHDENGRSFWDTHRSNFESGRGNAFDDGERRRKLQQVKNFSGEGLVFTGPVRDKEYLRLLHDADVEESEKLRLCSARLRSLVKDGRDLDEREWAQYKTKIGDLESRMKGVALGGAAAAHSFAKWAGRGLWSKSDIAGRWQFKKYIQDRNDVVSALANKFAPNSSMKSRVMNKFKHILQNAQLSENGMVDPATFKLLMDALNDEIEKDNAHVKEGVEALNKVNDALCDFVERHNAESDSMWIFRVLQICMIVSPFAGISLLGPVFDAVGAIFEYGIADGVAHLVTSDYLGPFGELSEFLHFDDAISWTLGDSPLLGDTISVIDEIITGSIGSEVFGGLFAVADGSPLAPLVVAGVFSIFRGPAEIEYAKKYGHQAYEKHKKALNDTVYQLHKKERKEDVEFGGFVQKKYDIFKGYSEVESLCEFVRVMMENGCVDLLGGDEFRGFLTKEALLKDYKIDYGEMRKVLGDMREDNSLEYKKILDKLLLFRGFEYDLQKNTDNPDFQAVVEGLREHKADEQHDGRLIADGASILLQEFDVAVAKMRGAEVRQDLLDARSADSLKNSEEWAKGLREQMIKDEAEYLKQQAQKKIDLKQEEAKFYARRPRSVVGAAQVTSLRPSFAEKTT